MRRSPTAGLLATVLLLALAPGAGAVDFQRDDYTVAGTQGQSVAVGDIDGATGPDVVVADYASGMLTRRLNDGRGGFAANGQSYPACKADQVELADVTTNGTDFVPDGKLDALVFCVDTTTLARMAGDGAGGFGAPVYSSSLNSPSLIRSDHFAVGAFTDYARPPLVVFRTQDKDFAGVFCALYDYTSDSSCYQPPAYPAIGGPMVRVDFGADGKDELLTLGGSKGLVGWGITPGPPRTWSAGEYPGGTGFVGAGLSLLTAGDFTGDGLQDAVTGSSTSGGGALNVIPNSSAGLSSAVPRRFPTIASVDVIVPADFDRDGKLDVLAVGGYGRAAIHIGDGAGNLGIPQDVPILGAGDTSKATTVDAVAADVDCDGAPDAVVLDRLAGAIEVLRNRTPAGPVGCPATGGGGPAPGLPGAPTPGGGGPGPIPVPPKTKPLAGLKRLPATITAGKRGTLALGRAANPPTRSVAVTLTVPKAGKASAPKRRPATVAKATVRIPAGKTRALTATLNAAGRKLLRRHKRVKLTATYVATGTDGARATRRKAVTLKRAKR